MEWDLVVLSAIVANDIEAFRSVIAHDGFLRAALRAALGRHHIALVKHLLLLFGKQKDLLTLHTRNFYIRHRSSPIV
jgi:hypothetical protein